MDGTRLGFSIAGPALPFTFLRWELKTASLSLPGPGKVLAEGHRLEGAAGIVVIVTASMPQYSPGAFLQLLSFFPYALSGLHAWIAESM